MEGGTLFLNSGKFDQITFGHSAPSFFLVPFILERKEERNKYSYSLPRIAHEVEYFWRG